MSSVIVSFDKGRPQRDMEKVREDKQLNEDIRVFVKGNLFYLNFQHYNNYHLDYVDRVEGSGHVDAVWDQILKNEDLFSKSKYGLLEKKGLIENIFESLTKSNRQTLGDARPILATQRDAQ